MLLILSLANSARRFSTSDGTFVEAFVNPPGERDSKRSAVVPELSNPEWSDARFELYVAKGVSKLLAGSDHASITARQP